ncbi:type VII secretion protein EccE [Mycobacterium bourgelatii]|uniref:Type VII secretion protein EccE n=1 Tax=Mycobacterium bourgelatii TaxID=1273442 RepID=A0A7I9YHC7_MYCBU|nr:type VII secretion protein EccE [Mycobacterium bourgelatii]MCV6976763.1 type VII secretion protein EccE [Mycobacterium bourgelatii]GFG88054.1 type VII secretion protein EccE [Mycobacterium bourgelatii]
MSVTGSIPVPGSGRITLGLLAVVPAVMAYPWQSTRERWILGVAIAVVIVLFGWWRGLHFTTILRRRVAVLGRRSAPRPEAGIDTRTTALLRIGPPASNGDVLPLPLIARYLDRYGVRADAIRITNRDTASGDRETWIGLILSAADNLAALQARSSQIPLHETAQVAARRLADHLREKGWEASTVGSDEVPEVIAPDARETWSAVRQSDSDYVAAYRVSVDSGLADRLTAIRSHPARETWTALEIASASGPGSQLTVAAACAFRTDERPGGGVPVGGLTPQRGSQWSALLALDPLSTQRLDGHTTATGDLLNQLVWPAPAAGNHRGAPSEAATEVTRT